AGHGRVGERHRTTGGADAAAVEGGGIAADGRVGEAHLTRGGAEEDAAAALAGGDAAAGVVADGRVDERQRTGRRSRQVICSSGVEDAAAAVGGGVAA